MNIQQLEYIVAVDKFNHFVKAAEHCGVSQPTLSMMIQKLETELGVDIFNRTKHPVQTTEIGKRIIEQAERTILEMKKVSDVVADTVDMLSGPLHIGVIPTLSLYLIPSLIKNFRANYPDIDLQISEMTTDTLINALNKGEIDMFLAATPLKLDNFFEIPLYYERFVAYFSKDHPDKDVDLSSENMPKHNLWVLGEGHCFRDQIFNFCTDDLPYNEVFETGSIDTLVNVVDINGGYSLIPELHQSFLSDWQKENVRKIDNPPAIREISLVIKKDFIKEKMINAVADSVKATIPEAMLDERLKKFSIRLF